MDDFQAALESYHTAQNLLEKHEDLERLVNRAKHLPTNCSDDSATQGQLKEELLLLKEDVQRMTKQLNRNYEELQEKEEENKKLREMALRLELTVRHLSDVANQPCCVENCVVF